MFKLQKESFGYSGQPVLADVTLTIEAGEQVALVGESGSGKSTLLSLLHSRYRAQCTYIPQDSALVRTLSVFHNVYMGSLHRHSTAYNLLNLAWPQAREVERVRPLLARVGLEDKLFSRVGELSGGQQQRTAICRSLLQGGEALLADEPVSAADIRSSRQSLEALTETFDTVVLAMHDVALALEYTQRIVGIMDGRIVLDSPTRGLKPADIEYIYRTRSSAP